MLTVSDLITCSGKHAGFQNQFEQLSGDLQQQYIKNAKKTVGLVSLLLSHFGEDRVITSGWRPISFNAATPGASANSNHTKCLAADIEDVDGKLADWCLGNEDTLKELGCYIEHPDYTRTGSEKRPGLPAIDGGWVHIQPVAPKSGNIIFIPF